MFAVEQPTNRNASLAAVEADGIEGAAPQKHSPGQMLVDPAEAIKHRQFNQGKNSW